MERLYHICQITKHSAHNNLSKKHRKLFTEPLVFVMNIHIGNAIKELGRHTSPANSLRTKFKEIIAQEMDRRHIKF